MYNCYKCVWKMIRLKYGFPWLTVLFQLYMQEIGHNVLGTSISVHLANLLKGNWRLPPPLNCPPKVRLLCAVETVVFSEYFLIFAIVSQSDLWRNDFLICLTSAIKSFPFYPFIPQSLSLLILLSGVPFDEAVLGT